MKEIEMLKLRKSEERGYADHGWLKSYHSFSFADYYDPKFVGWGNLLVINEDRIEPGTGFGEHSHRDMEIISYVLSGDLAHKDSMGNVKGIPPGDVQRMSAGTGVSHSEFNHAEGQQTHFLQIWIKPKFTGIKPDYEQITIPTSDKLGALRLVASPDGANSSVKINADAKMYAGLFDKEQTAKLDIDPKRKAYVHLIKGALKVNGQQLKAGDALMIEQEAQIALSGGAGAEVLVFDLTP
jgi:redox-sensitive bicupin YhaK (pirin superfamily)